MQFRCPAESYYVLSGAPTVLANLEGLSLLLFVFVAVFAQQSSKTHSQVTQYAAQFGLREFNEIYQLAPVSTKRVNLFRMI